MRQSAIAPLLLAMLALMATPSCSRQAQPPPAPRVLGVCSSEQLLGVVPKPEEVEAHRKFALPTIDYPAGTTRENWGLQLTLRISEAGQVECYEARYQYDKAGPLNAEQSMAVQRLRESRYTPFMRDGSVVPAIITEQVAEQELPAKHVPLPEVPLEQVRFTLERTGCYGWCPSYCIQIHGDGRVVYEGGRYVDVLGRHEYRLPKADVARLVASARAKNLWSMKSEYRAGITDSPTYLLTMQMGDQTHRIVDYVGERVGKPPSITEFEKEMDAIARSAMWIGLESEAVGHLKAEGFKFDSLAGGELLARAAAGGRSHDPQALAELIELGAPLNATVKTEGFRLETKGPLLEDALRHRMGGPLAALLIKKGALDTNGERDQRKIDSAFLSAIEGGRLENVKEIWNAAGPQTRPSLNFETFSDGDKPVRKQSPVTLRLYKDRDDEGWEGLRITQWLVEQGCDLKGKSADGETLLHIVSRTDDSVFVRYLLDSGLDPNSPGEDGGTPLGGADNEDVALMLLQAGADLALVNSDGYRYSDFVQHNNWRRVAKWLDDDKALRAGNKAP